MFGIGFERVGDNTELGLRSLVLPEGLSGIPAQGVPAAVPVRRRGLRTPTPGLGVALVV